MKIGIMTLWGCSNYGQNLQAYALQRFLRDAGHDVFLIRYPLIEYMDENPYLLFKSFIKKILPPIILYIIYFLKGKKHNLFVYKKIKLNRKLLVSPSFTFYRDPSYLIHLREIGLFLNMHVNQTKSFYSSIQELKKNPPEADVYITGSDQVWNFWGKPLLVAEQETLDAYFLNFGKNETKRIAYAASFGTRTIDKSCSKIIMPLVNSFSFISVREEYSLSLCKQCGCENAEWVPDPTLLFDGNHYRTLYNNHKIRKQNIPFCFVYMIRDNPFFLYKLSSWVKNKNLSMVLITNSGLIQHNYDETFATIPEWLYLIDNAEFVITDSYHGSIFSIIFNKLFGIIPFIDCNKDIRLNDLFKRFNMRYPLLDDYKFTSFTTNDEMETASKILLKLHLKYTFEWFNRILKK